MWAFRTRPGSDAGGEAARPRSGPVESLRTGSFPGDPRPQSPWSLRGLDVAAEVHERLDCLRHEPRRLVGVRERVRPGAGGGVDDEAVNEARAGAKLAGAGFVAVNVANERQARPLLPLLAGAASGADGVLDAPAVLVFQRPKKLFVRLEGFADRDTVAQAATNAAPAPAGALHA